MKQIISGKELEEKMIEAVNLICNAVKTTLGPKGTNVIINDSSMSPYITNDGVTIAQNIESDDEVINTILEITKEASINTNDIVGDGTTTTLVFLQKIFNLGIKEIKANKINPIILKKELDNALKKVIYELKKESHRPSKEELKTIAITSSNDYEIGKIVSNTFFKIKNKNAIKILENDQNRNCVEYLKGYNFETIIVSPYFFDDNKNIEYDNCYVLLINDYVDQINNIELIINKIYEENSSLIIISDDYSEDFINQILELYLNENIKIVLLKTPSYGYKKKAILKDISFITNTKVIENKEHLSLDNLGLIDNISISKNNTNILFKNSNLIKERIKQIKKETKNSFNEIDLDFINERISMFKNGKAIIHVGANTLTEAKEKKMRYDDSLCSIDSSLNGVIYGGGVTYYKISDTLKENTIANNILKETLKEPFNVLMNNSALDKDEILNTIVNNDFNLSYNVVTNKYDNTVLDSLNLAIYSISNAVSIAGMLLTTSYLIINEYIKKEYSEI